jgi:hypothetical protein
MIEVYSIAVCEWKSCSPIDEQVAFDFELCIETIKTYFIYFGGRTIL